MQIDDAFTACPLVQAIDVLGEEGESITKSLEDLLSGAPAGS